MNRREFVTEILHESQKDDVIEAIVGFLTSKSVAGLQATLGFVVERDLRGEKQGEDTLVPLMNLQEFIERGLQEGTIEWSGTSDFQLAAVDIDLELTLCNDSDLHFASHSGGLLMELSRTLFDSGVKIFESGKLISEG